MGALESYAKFQPSSGLGSIGGVISGRVPQGRVTRTRDYENSASACSNGVGSSSGFSSTSDLGMTAIYLFSDEAGDFDFEGKPNSSKYLIICTILTDSIAVGQDLIHLRHELVRGDFPLLDYFHATADKQDVRDAVFDTILRREFIVQAQVCEKSKAYPHIRRSKARFYKYPWYYLVKHGVARHLHRNSHLYATAASIGTRKERTTYVSNLRDVLDQNVGCSFSVDFRPSMADPCLQVADYCAWAIQRKWELGDARSYELIADRITYEYDLWNHRRLR